MNTLSDGGQTARHLAAKNGHWDVVQILEAKGTYVDTSTQTMPEELEREGPIQCGVS